MERVECEKLSSFVRTRGEGSILYILHQIFSKEFFNFPNLHMCLAFVFVFSSTNAGIYSLLSVCFYSGLWQGTWSTHLLASGSSDTEHVCVLSYVYALNMLSMNSQAIFSIHYINSTYVLHLNYYTSNSFSVF